MTEAGSNKLNKELQKEKIRERYKGINLDLMEVIPAKKQADFDDDTFRRVAVYVRVSTDNLQQTSSYELQKNYYEDRVQKHDNWSLVDIYADEGISGTSLSHRDAFNRMIEDCKAGKIDMIITKSVSRFSRNVVDCKTIVQTLCRLNNPVGVYFEADNLFSLNQKDSMRLSMMAMLAEEESHTKSSIMNASLEMRFGHGIVLTPVLLGFDHNEDGDLVINENEAHSIQLIFFMYLYGYTCKEIAEMLEKLGRRTKKGNCTWSASTVSAVLRNERYCGDVLTWKTYTDDFLNHKSKKNRGDRIQHRWRDHHDAIISRDDYIAVQHLLENAKYGNKGILPELIVILDGSLKGFVSINPRWAGFHSDDYFEASQKVDEETEQNGTNVQIEAQSGEFDFRGFEITRSQFFNAANGLCVTFSTESLNFSSLCIRKLNDAQYIEMLIHPMKKFLIIYDKYGFHVLDRTLRLCIATWEGDSVSLSANMLKGVAKLVDTFGDKMRDDVFKDKLGQFSPKEIARTAKDRRAGSLGFAEAILLAYNKKMKFSLKWGDLYSNKRSQEYDDNYDMSDESDETNEVGIDNKTLIHI